MDPTAILTKHTLLTEAWTGQVQTIETAIRRFKADRHLANDCQVVMFEIPDDRHLHVNVMHKYPTAEVGGWAGPGRVPFGVVHNRRFGDTTTHQIIRHIRDMVFAARSSGRQRTMQIGATDVIRTR
jgi:hypothetical protein